MTLTRQLRSAGVDIPYGNYAIDEGTAKSMGGDAEGVYLAASYISSLDTPANREFLQAIKDKFGDDAETPHELSVPLYDGIYAYAAAVEKAGSTEPSAVIDALSEVTVEGPRGAIKMDKQRHAALTMYLGKVASDGSVEVVKSFKNVDPGEQCPQFAD